MKRSKRKSSALLFAFILGICSLTAAQANQGVNILLAKARALEARGRCDLAAQNWRQVLLVSPVQTEALAGLARCAKQNGDAEGERAYLARLRKVNPKDPALESIGRTHVPTAQERDRLDEAGRLTLAHKPDEAMKIYRDIFGDEPASGKWAGPFYEAEAASSGGREKAVSQLRRLCASEPGNEIARLWLARELTYDPKTRMEGFRLLESIQDPGSVEQARGPWRQALLWEKDNPAVLKPLDAYLQRYPDSELQSIQAVLREKEERALADANKERGFQALRDKDIGTAQARFEEVLRRSPNDLNAIAGLGFVRLNQKKFDEALTLFDRARALAPQRSDVRKGYDTAKFWLAMLRGKAALDQNRPDAAIAAYREALGMRPQDDQAMLALGQAMVHARQYGEAESEFNQVLSRSPANPDAMAGLGFIRLNQGKFDDAQRLLGEALRISPGRRDIDEGYRNARYWGVLKRGADALSQNRVAEAITNYQQALVLHPGAREALMGLAESNERTGNASEAVKAYSELTTSNSGEARGWLGLMKAQVEVKDPGAALATAQRIPSPLKQQVEQRSDYLSELALVYYSMRQAGEGNQVLHRALAAARSSDTEAALNVRLQVAKLLMDDGNVERATEIYKQATEAYPKNSAAWQGLIGADARLRNFDAAMAALRSMPEASYVAASRDASFLNSVAVVYSAAGQCSKAEEFLNRSLSADREAGREPAENTQLQLADIWRREQNYERARRAYRAIIDHDRSSVEAWRNYFVVLHEQRADQEIVTEARGIPSPVYTRLAGDAGFLILLAAAHRATGHNEEVIRLLQQARSRYQSQGQTPPADLDVQLSWALADSPQHTQELVTLLAKARTRGDLTTRQRKAIDEISSISSVRRAREAMIGKQADQSIAILLEAQRELPNDRRIQSALGATYLRLHDYHKALEVYAAWGMAGAEAGDYRAVIGAALATHNEILADGYLREGLEKWPKDADLLQMAAKQAVAEGKYDEAKHELKLALAATRNRSAGVAKDTLGEKALRDIDRGPEGFPIAGSTGPAPAPSTMSADCLPATNSAKPAPSRARLIDASYALTADSADPQNQAGTAQPDAAQPTAGQSTSGPSSAAQSTTAQPNNDQPATAAPTPPTSAPSTVAQSAADPQREQKIQDEIDVVQDRNTPVISMGDAATGRSGDQGLNRLIVEDGALGDSITAANRLRFAVEAHGVYLFSGTPDGTSGLQLGTLPKGATFAEQTAAGYAAEAQLSTNTFGLAFGTSPQGFPIHNLTGGLRFRPLGGPFTFMFVRDGVKDSLLSYAGVRDPGTGTIWGGVVSNAGSMQFSRSVRTNGQYVNVGYSFIQGTNSPDNWNVSASAGTYWQIVPGLTLGLNVAGMHYDRNLSFFSLGQGGYFSPQKYYLASVPISWFSRHRRFEYEIRAALGVQYLSNDTSPLFPTLPQLSPGSFYAGSVDTGPNYNFSVRIAYKMAPHWYLETFGAANNSQNFATQTIGFTLRYLMHRLPANTDLHVKSIPDWRGRQPFSLE